MSDVDAAVFLFIFAVALGVFTIGCAIYCFIHRNDEPPEDRGIY